jgi:ABC-type branched-subunit amino acid transport system ATPase component
MGQSPPVNGRKHLLGSVELRNGTKTYGAVEVISSLHLTIGNIEFVCLVGPSGLGNSTRLRMIAGLETITGGDVLIEGQVATLVEPLECGIAMVFGSCALSTHMNVCDKTAFNLRL